MTISKKCHQCGGSLLFMPACHIGGYVYCAGCCAANVEAQKVFEYGDAALGKPVDYMPGVGYVTRPVNYTDCSAYSTCKEGEKRMVQNVHISAFHEVPSRPKFKVGDRVKFGFGQVGTIKEVSTRYTYTIESRGTNDIWSDLREYTLDESALEDVPLTPEEAWDKVAIMIAKRVMTNVVLFGIPLSERIAKAIRHDAYVILGGAHIKIGENGGPVKTRVRGLITQAQQ